MKVKFTKSLFVGVRTYAAGETADLPDDRAKHLIGTKHALPFVAPAPQSAAVKPTENAAKPKPAPAAKPPKLPAVPPQT